VIHIEAFIFDLDGVLVDSYQCWWNLIHEVLEARGKALSHAEFDASWGQGPEEDQRMFFPGWSVAEVLKFYEERFPAHARVASAEPGIADLLRVLSAAQKRMAVASNSPTAIIRSLLEATRLDSLIRTTIGVEEVKAAKPAPDLIFATLERLDVAAAEACYVGDSIFDEEAARAAGVLFIGYKRPGDISIQHFDELRAMLAGGRPEACDS